jgi:hypothetical protein
MMRSFVLFLLLACASAFELATLANRRAVIAKIAAAAPLAAFVQQASAKRVTNAALTSDWSDGANSNQVLGTPKALAPGIPEEKLPLKTDSTKTVDTAGATLPKSAKYDGAGYATLTAGLGGNPKKDKAYEERLARLLAQ